MILAIFDKEKILTENGKGRIHHISVGSGLAKPNTLVIFAQHDEGNTYVYASARLVEQEEFDQWRLSTIRPFVAERQLLHASKIQELESDAVHFLHEDLKVTKTLEKMCIDNAAVELEIAYNILDENLWMSDLLLSDRRITPQYTDQDLLRSAYQMANEATLLRCQFNRKTRVSRWFSAMCVFFPFSLYDRSLYFQLLTLN